jgi:hypothetical protein
MNDLEHYKQLARKANARGDQMMVARIIGLHLEQLFGDDHRAAHRFYTEFEQTAPRIYYNPMQSD